MTRISWSSRSTWSNKRVRGFGVLYLVTAFVILGFIAFIGLYVAGMQDTGNGLIPISTGPQNVRIDNATNPNGTAVGQVSRSPRNFVKYTSPAFGFSFDFPDAWGKLKQAAGNADGPNASPLLSLTTEPRNEYSLSEAMLVQVESLDTFRIGISSNGAIVSPFSSGTGFLWNVVDKGKSNLAIGRTYDPAPPIAYRSGKAVVYAFSASQGSCTYTTWAFAVQAQSKPAMARLRLPSFCISGKVADAEVQAQHKTDFENIKSTIVQSITVL